MNTIKVNFGTAPNGVRVWGIGYNSEIVKDKTCALAIEKPHLDKTLPETKTSADYYYLVAKELSIAFEDKLINKDEIYNYKFVCEGMTYTKTK